MTVHSSKSTLAGKTEFELWGNGPERDSRQKSFVVQVLHWFHYRPTRLKASWRQEEVLTWELCRALELLPQKLFLHQILWRISTLGDNANAAALPLIKGNDVCVTPYPSLKLLGGKRNCKSDIGLGMGGGATIWIEAKTASFKSSELEVQLHQQRLAMSRSMPNEPTALITLLPKSRAIESFPNLSWDDVLASAKYCSEELDSAIPDPGLSRGYRLLARELAARIESHPNRAKDWV